MKKKIRLIFLTLVALIAVFSAVPAYATIALPDSTPTATFYVYRNLLETGDWLVLIYQDVPYAVTPTEMISNTFIWRMFAVDGVTELGTVAPYSWADLGYGYNVVSMYWDAATVTANGMVWGTNYTMRLSGNPLAFTSPPEYNYALAASNYSVLTTTADVQAELASRILTIAADLDMEWGITYSLLNETESGTVLSIYGEAFFRGAIYGLQGLCPQVFAYVVNGIDLTARTWAETYVATLENQYAGTWVDTAKAAGKTLFGVVSYDLTSLIITILVAAALGIATVIMSGDVFHGLCDARTGLIVMTRLGFMDLGSLGLLAALAVIYGSIRMWGVMK